MNNYRFVTTLFGEKHLGMLLVNLYSIYKNAPHAKVSVFWQEISEEKKDSFKKTFPNVDFQETNFDLSSSKIKRISSKTILWNHAAQVLPAENICFFDADMLVLKDIGSFFDKDFDILFTDKKEEIFPLNTGVILTKGDAKKTFMKEWLNKTLEIINDEFLLKQAVSTDYPFGGADQMSFHQMVGYQREKEFFNVDINGEKLKFVSVPCAVLNETRSIDINNDMRIIHYKGGWQMIMLEGKGFTKSRSKKSSWSMYMLYLKIYKDAINYMNKKSGSSYDASSLGIKIPFYLNKETLKEDKFLYGIFSTIKTAESIFDSVVYKIGLKK